MIIFTFETLAVKTCFVELHVPCYNELDAKNMRNCPGQTANAIDIFQFKTVQHSFKKFGGSNV